MFKVTEATGGSEIAQEWNVKAEKRTMSRWEGWSLRHSLSQGSGQGGVMVEQRAWGPAESKVRWGSDTTSWNRREGLLWGQESECTQLFRDTLLEGQVPTGKRCQQVGRREEERIFTQSWNRPYRKGTVLSAALGALSHLIFKTTLPTCPHIGLIILILPWENRGSERLGN